MGRKPVLVLSSLGILASMAALGTYFYLEENLEVVCVAADEALATTTTPCVPKDGFSQATLDSLSWLPVTTLFLFKFAHAFGLGPLAIMLQGEFFASEAKEVSSTAASTFSQLCGFLVSKFQVDLENALGTAGLYYLYGGFAAVSVIFCAFVLPETKGRTAKEMKAMFTKSHEVDKTGRKV